MKSLAQDIEQAAKTLLDGGSILYPTDTVWGIGCDAQNEEAVRNIFRIKARPEEQSLILLLDDKEKLQRYTEICPEIICDLLDASDKPLTVIYPAAKNLAPSVIAADGSIAIRIVDHPFCSPLLQMLDRPIVSTSANTSGDPTPLAFSQVTASIYNEVDYVVENFRLELRNPKPSSIIRFDEKGNFEVIRE